MDILQDCYLKIISFITKVQGISNLSKYPAVKHCTACWDNIDDNALLEQMADVPFSFISSLFSAPDHGISSFIRALTHEPWLSGWAIVGTVLSWPSASAVPPDTLHTDGHVLITTVVTFHNAVTLLSGSAHILRHTCIQRSFLFSPRSGHAAFLTQSSLFSFVRNMRSLRGHLREH